MLRLVYIHLATALLLNEEMFYIRDKISPISCQPAGIIVIQFSNYTSIIPSICRPPPHSFSCHNVARDSTSMQMMIVTYPLDIQLRSHERCSVNKTDYILSPANSFPLRSHVCNIYGHRRGSLEILSIGTRQNGPSE